MLVHYMGSQVKQPKPDPKARRILDALRSIVRELRLASVSSEKRFGLSAAQLFVLQTLRDEPGLSLGELAERTATDQSSVSVVVRKLEEKKLVQKGVSGEDRRRLEISLTAVGGRLVAKAPPAVQELLIQRIAALSGKEKIQLAELLDRFALPGAGAQPMFFEDQKKRTKRA